MKAMTPYTHGGVLACAVKTNENRQAGGGQITKGLFDIVKVTR